jgi:hypothetical protein
MGDDNGVLNGTLLDGYRIAIPRFRTFHSPTLGRAHCLARLSVEPTQDETAKSIVRRQVRGNY